MNPDIFSTIESPDIAASLGVASSLRTFLRIADRLPAIQAMSAAIDLEGPQEVEARLSYIIGSDVDDGRHRSPRDYAATVYLRSLSERSRIAEDIANNLARESSGRWFWASQLAKTMIKTAPAVYLTKILDPTAVQPSSMKTSATNAIVIVAFQGPNANPSRLRSLVR